MHKETIGKTEFTFRIAETAKLLDEVLRLRYQVYCEECKFIKEEHLVDNKEQDKYDEFAVHFLAQDKYGIIGAVRLIFDSPAGFPVEEHYKEELSFNKDSISRSKIAEISRLVITKDYRRRRDDGLYYTPELNEKTENDMASPNNPFRRIRTMTFGLYREVYQESKRRGLTHWLAIMAKPLWVLLSTNGFTFEPIGKEFEYFGMVKPYLGTIEAMEKNFSQKYPEFFVKYFLDGLEPEFRPKLALASHGPI